MLAEYSNKTAVVKDHKTVGTGNSAVTLPRDCFQEND